MTRELLILRHGKSDWDTGLPDFNRPLKKRGKRGARRVGSWLRQQGLQPDRVISSPAERAITTACTCCKSMDVPNSTITEDGRIYMATRDSLLTVLGEVPGENQRIMLVGHNPGLEELLLYLVGDDAEYGADGKLLPTATLAQLTMPSKWIRLSRGCATLQRLVRPASLSEEFP